MIKFEDLKTEISEVKDLFNSKDALVLDEVLKLLDDCNFLDSVRNLKNLKLCLRDISLINFVENWIYILDTMKSRGFLNNFGVFKSFDELVNENLITLNSDSSWLVSCNDELTGFLYLPDYIKVICSDAFADCVLTEVVLNDSLEEILDRAFYDCPFLKRIVIPKNIKAIPFKCFFNCCSLSEVILNNDCEECFDDSFYGTKINRIIFGKSMANIHKGAFRNCFELEEVLFIENNLRVIGREAFSGCKKLKSFDIFESVNRVDEKAFKDCKNCIINLFSGSLYVCRDSFEDCKKVNTYISAESF